MGRVRFRFSSTRGAFDFSLLTTFSISAARDLACRVTAPLEANQSSLELRSNRPLLCSSQPTIIMGVRRVACYTPSSSSSSAFSSRLLSERGCLPTTGRGACFLSSRFSFFLSSRRLQLRPATRFNSIHSGRIRSRNFTCPVC